jgi:hypothetical protein
MIVADSLASPVGQRRAADFALPLFRVTYLYRTLGVGGTA